MKLGIRRIVMTLAGVATLSASVLSTAGCGAFFKCEGKADCGTTSTATSSGDYAYVLNNVSTANDLDAFDVSKGTLASLSGSPYALDTPMGAIAVAPNNSFLYTATLSQTVAPTTPYIYEYSLASTGVPSNAVKVGTAIGQVSAMTISPDGNWLYTIELSGVNGTSWALQQYQVNSSSGALTASTSFPLPTATGGCAVSYTTSLPYTQLCSIAVSPSEEYVIVAIAGGGAVIYPYSSSATGGITSASNYVTLAPFIPSSADTSVTVDGSNYAYIGQTNSITPYSVTVSSGAPSATALTSTGVFGTTKTPRNVTLSIDYAHLYSADQDTGAISQYTVAAGVLSTLGSDVAAPTKVSALGVDNTGGYLLAAGYNSTSGIQLYSITSGVLTNLNQNAATGTNYAYPALVAMTH